MTQLLPHLQVERDAGVVTLTLDRADARNAYSDDMITSLVRAFADAQADSTVHCVVLTGAGSAFSAGGDLRAMQERSGMFAGTPVELRTRYVEGIQSIPRAIARFEKPLIAAVNGPAIGAGLDLACMCDIRIAATSATFGSTFVKVGLVPGDGGAYFLGRVIGFAPALECMLTGRIFDAQTARSLGLVSRVCPPEELLQEARALAQEIARNPPWAVRMTKRAAYRSYHCDLETALELASSYQGLVQHTAEHDAAVAALLAARAKSPT